MNHRLLSTVAVITCGALLLASCTGQRKAPTTSSASTSSSGTANSSSDVPKVNNPLPDKVVDGDPCESALTAEQVSKFLGTTSSPKSSDDALGTACDWASSSGSGAGASVGYQIKSDQGIGLAFQSVKPTAPRWESLNDVQGYPAIAYVAPGLDPSDKRNCVVVVGISDKTAYSVSLTLGDRAVSQGKDSCVIGRDIADAVMTNLKGRA